MKKNNMWTIIMSILLIGCLPGLSAALDNSHGGIKAMANQPSLTGSVNYENDTSVSGGYRSNWIKLRAQADTGSDSSGENGGSSSGTDMENPGSATTPEEGVSPGTNNDNTGTGGSSNDTNGTSGTGDTGTTPDNNMINPGTGTNPGTETTPGTQQSPGTQSTPNTTPGTGTVPGTETAPGTGGSGGGM